jgi:Protein of unknown function (DUF1214)
VCRCDSHPWQLTSQTQLSASKRNSSATSQLQQLVGESSYEVTFPKGQLPPVKGFWSLTVYNPEHFFYPNALNRYPLGTKNKTLKYNDDGNHGAITRTCCARNGPPNGVPSGPLLARRLLAKPLPHIPEVVTAAEFGADAKLDVAAL